MWRKVIKCYDLTVKRETIYRVLQLADPDGLTGRFGNRLRRRMYKSPGPNFLFHLDGYDKLKPFGFCIHGCIDGFSRYLIWLEVATTNKDPLVCAYYYLKAIKKLGFLPTVVRADHGTENVWIESMQTCLRKDHCDDFSGLRSYIQGKSTRNQRIESFWGRFRRHTADFYIRLFKTMQEEGLFDGSKLHLFCLQFCFGPVIKRDLIKFTELWNEHLIRKQSGQNIITGKPTVMFHCPHLFNARDCQKEVNLEAVEIFLNEKTTKPVIYNENFKELADLVYPANKIATTPEEAFDLYVTLLEKIELFGT